jgi:hypothetical protein
MYFVTLDAPATVSPLIKNKARGTKNFWRYLKTNFGVRRPDTGSKKRKRAPELPPVPKGTAAEAAARLFSGVSAQGASLAVASSSQRTFRYKVEQHFSAAQLRALLVAAILLSGAAVNTLAHPYFRLFLWASSAAVISGCDRKTFEEYEESFVKQLKGRFEALFRRARLLNAGGAAIKHKLPRYSLSCDKSTTDIQGWQTITINLHFFDDANKRKKVNLGVLKFQLSDEADVSKGTGKNIATFIVARLKEFNLVPTALVGLDVSAYVYAVSTDNASTEVSATLHYLRCRSQTCSAHTLALVLKNALMPGGAKSRPLILMDKLAEVAKAHKIGKGKAMLLVAQSSNEPVAVNTPLCLLSRCKTRWSDAFRLVERAVLLRAWLDNAFFAASQPAFTEDDWTVLIQMMGVLRVFHETIVALQARDLCIGGHLALIYRLALLLKQPERLKIHPSDYVPSPEQLNDPTFSLWAPAITTGDSRALHPDVTVFVSAAYGQILARCELLPDGKRQLNSLHSMLCLFYEPKMKWLVFDTHADSIIFSMPQKTAAKTELVRLMRLCPHRSQQDDAAPQRAASHSITDFTSDPLFDAPAPRVALLPGALPEDRRVVDPALEELRRWQLDTQFDGLKMQDVWFSVAAKTAYPILAWLFPYIASLEHCTAECERDFSVLARLLTPLRRGRMKMQTVERKMILLLNDSLWHPLPDRADERFVQEAFARFKIDAPTEPLFADDDSDDEDFV